MKRKNLIRILVLMVALGGAALPFVSGKINHAQTKADFAQTVQPFLAENCVTCHNAKSQSGGLDLAMFTSAEQISQHRDKWDVVLLKLRTGEMPPKGMPRPSEAELKSVITWLENEFERADRNVAPDPGRVTARRLNRAEYNNTVRDLLGVNFHPADDFPQDDSGYGFDNIGDVLSLSPVLMEKYLTAAEKIARTAVFGTEVLKPSLARFRSSGGKIESRTTPLTDYDVTGLGLPNALHAKHRFPATAEYNLRVLLGGVRPSSSEPLPLALWVDGQQIQTINFDGDGIVSFSDDRQDFGGQAVNFKAKISAGDHTVAVSILRLYEGLPVKYGGVNPSKRPEPPPPPFRPPTKNATPERIAEFRKRYEARLAEKIPINEARVASLEIAGPYNQVKGATPESLQKIYVCGHLDGKHQSGCGRKIIGNLARHAYRRAVTPEEVNKLIGLVSLVQKRGDSFQEGLVQAIQALLVSPHFLFRIEQDRKNATAENIAPLGAYELASRLSYFLWSSMPDDELLRTAENASLQKPEVLAAQLRRMMQDPKANALVENFGGQWLELRKLESAKPDRDRFPQFDEYLRASMQRETELFFANLVREDRSILDFIDANYTFLNEKLARFYGVPGITGPEFRKVTLPAETQRGGILTHASVLTVSSYTTRTSPVLRGKWILENVLNAPPPPPPPDVPNLDDAKIGASVSLRQQLEEHRKNSTCASCHARMDPLGFGLENFDAIGAWRTKDGKFPIDSSGTLPDGRMFKGAQELKVILRADKQAFAEGLTEKLMIYALGRGLERYDKPTVRKVARNVAAQDFRFSSLVTEIVNSLPFQYRRGANASAAKTD